MRNKTTNEESFKSHTRRLFRERGTNIQDVYKELDKLDYADKIIRLKQYLYNYTDAEVIKVYDMYCSNHNPLEFIDSQIAFWTQKKRLLVGNGL